MELRDISLRFERKAVEELLSLAGIRLAPGLDYCCGLFEGEALIACGGYEGATIQCVAVTPSRQGEALLNSIISHLYTRLRQAGIDEVFVFTKPGNVPLFRTLGFTPLAEATQAALLTSRPAGLQEYLAALDASDDGRRPAGAIVMNANPFTCGHRYLVELAAARAALLHVFVVEEEKSDFPFAVRLKLVREGTADLENVRVHPGGRYIISAATFPSYFLKDPSGAASAHAELDATLFAQRIAPRLGISLRFAGSEPLDPLTGLYNDAMRRVMPAHGIALTVFERKEQAGAPVSASRVRKLLKAGEMEGLRGLVPDTTYAYLVSEEGRALCAHLRARA